MMAFNDNTLTLPIVIPVRGPARKEREFSSRAAAVCQHALCHGADVVRPLSQRFHILHGAWRRGGSAHGQPNSELSRFFFEFLVRPLSNDVEFCLEHGLHFLMHLY